MGDGWAISEPRLPEMRVPSEDELAAGYRGETWSASKGPWTLNVVWAGDQGKFWCSAMHTESPTEPREMTSLDYPHEVIEWLGTWNARVARSS